MTFDTAHLKPRYVPHKTMEESWTYISVPEDDTIIGVRIAVTKVMKLLNPDGTQAKDATGKPIYSFQSTNIVRTLTKEEYQVEKKRSIRE